MLSAYLPQAKQFRAAENAFSLPLDGEERRICAAFKKEIMKQINGFVAPRMALREFIMPIRDAIAQFEDAVESGETGQILEAMTVLHEVTADALDDMAPLYVVARIAA